MVLIKKECNDCKYLRNEASMGDSSFYWTSTLLKFHVK